MTMEYEQIKRGFLTLYNSSHRGAEFHELNRIVLDGI